MNDLVIRQLGMKALPDTDRYKKRFEVNSESSNRIYRLSFDVAGPYWTCSCPGNIKHGQCKHLDAIGVKGRKFGKNHPENKKYLKEVG